MEDWFVSYRLSTGEVVERSNGAVLCDRVRSRELSPLRLPNSYKGQKHRPGFLWMSSTNELVAYESRLEMLKLLELDRRPSLAYVLPQPFKLSYRVDGKAHSHIPDFMGLLLDDTIELVDVKPRRKLDTENNRRAFGSTEVFARSIGLSYSVFSEPPSPYVDNLKWLAGFRRRPHRLDHLADHILDGAAAQRSIEEICNGGAHHSALLRPALFHLLWKGILEVDLHSALLQNSTVVKLSSGAQ